MAIPIGRTTSFNQFGPAGIAPQVLHGTWLEAESFAYPNGGFTRRAYVELRKNPNRELDLPYGEKRVVKCSIPDTYFTIPARLTYKGRTVKGYISVHDDGSEETKRFTFTPEGR